VARDRSGRKDRIVYNQPVGSGDTSPIYGAVLFFGLFAWGMAHVTHEYSWVVFVVLLTAGWAAEVRARNRLVVAWNWRVAAENAAGISGAATLAVCMDPKIGDTPATGLAVPTHTGGFHFFAEGGGFHQFPPVEIVKIDRSLPYYRIQVTTTSTVWRTIVIEPQLWNIKAWELLKDGKTYREAQ
jgi:hypothetical protein